MSRAIAYSLAGRPWRLLAFAAVAGVLALRYGQFEGATLFLHLRGDTPRASGLYAFAFGPLSVVTALILGGPLILGWTGWGRRLGARAIGLLLGRGAWWLWPLLAVAGACQVYGLPLEIAAYGLCALGLLEWTLWRARASWLRGVARMRRRLARMTRSRSARLAGGAMVFVAVAAVSWTLSGWVDGHRYFVDDSIAQLMHARIVEQGRLSLPAPPMPEFYRTHQMICDGRWYSQYPPGHILAIAAFDAAGLLVWLTPLAAGAAALLAIAVGRRLYGWRTGLLGGALLATSPFFLLTYAEGMNHTTALVWFLLFLYGYERALRPEPARGERPAHEGRRGIAWAALAGFSAGVLVATRPLTGVCLAGAWGLWDAAAAVARAVHARRDQLGRAAVGSPPVLASWRALGRLWLWGALAAAIPLGFFLYFNAATTGSPLVPGYIALNGPSHRLGFDAFAGNGHTPRIGLIQTLNNLHSLGREFLHGWPVNGFLFVAFLFLIGRPRVRDLRLLATALALSLGYFFYFYQDAFLGPRFLFEALPLYALLSARGVEEAARRAAGAARISRAAARRSLYATLLLLAALAVETARRPMLREAVQNRGLRDRVLAEVERALASPNARVFVCAERDLLAFARNFDAGGPPRVLRDRGDEENARFMRAAPDYEYWLIRGFETRRLPAVGQSVPAAPHPPDASRAPATISPP